MRVQGPEPYADRVRATRARGFSTTERRGVRRRGLVFGPTAGYAPHGRPISAPDNASPRLVRGAGWRGRRCVTPRQTCPRPRGLGRNLRSKTRWFTGFCNSHQVSHFATFFIDARAEISVAESRFDSFRDDSVGRCPSESTRTVFRILGTSSAGVWLSPEEERRRGHTSCCDPPSLPPLGVFGRIRWSDWFGHRQ